MKSVVEMQKDVHNDIKYPCLMISSVGRIVMFNSYKCGVQINTVSSGNLEIGDYLNCWAIEDFKPFNGSVTLSND